MPFEDKVDLFSPLCSKYQWEYACNNTQRITLSASRCNKIHGDFVFFFFRCLLIVLSCVFLQMCTEVTMCFVHENDVSLSHGFKCFLRIFFSLFSWCEAFSRGFWRGYGQRVSVFFRWSFKSVHVTLHFVWETQEVSLASIVDGQINACR